MKVLWSVDRDGWGSILDRELCIRVAKAKSIDCLRTLVGRDCGFIDQDIGLRGSSFRGLIVETPIT